MARSIDPQKLEPQDVLYLKDRPWMVAEFRRQGFESQMDAVEEAAQPIPGSPYLETTTQDMSLGYQTNVLVDPASNGFDREADGEDPVVDDNYEEWSVEELKADIDARNAEEDRPKERKLSKAGSKEDLAKRLHEDDAAE